MSGSLSPIVFANHSQEFIAAARREHAIGASTTSMPAYFLAARGIELGLKSYLLLVGKKESTLRTISHDMEKAVVASDLEGLRNVIAVSADTETAVAWINGYYSKKDLEYPKTGYKSYPPLELLLQFGELLFTGLGAQRRNWRPSA
jgi:hypothetical protein